MSGPVIVSPPPRGARAAASRRKAQAAARLLKQSAGRWVGGKETEPSRGSADWQARKLVSHLARHTDLSAEQLERCTWEVASGPQSGRWRWAVRIRAQAGEQAA